MNPFYCIHPIGIGVKLHKLETTSTSDFIYSVVIFLYLNTLNSLFGKRKWETIIRRGYSILQLLYM